MAYQIFDSKEKRYQRKLIPVNIVVAILALVAAISLMFTPLVKVKLGDLAGVYTQMAGGSAGDDSVTEILDSVDEEVVIMPLGMAKVAFADEKDKASTLFQEILNIDNFLDKLIVNTVNTTLVGAAGDKELSSSAMKALENEFRKINNVKSEEEFTKVIDDYIEAIGTAMDAEVNDDVKEAIKADYGAPLYRETVEANGGAFSIEKMVAVIFSPTDEEGNHTKIYKSYGEVFGGILRGDFGVSIDGAEGITEVLNSVSNAMEVVNDYAGYMGYIFYGVLAFSVIWLILFITAFIRTFTKNKRYSMWYVKLLGFLPCLIFTVAPWVLSTFFADMVGNLAGVFAVLSSMTIISGICYGVLWLVSICWAFPIKRKIRKLRKAQTI